MSVNNDELLKQFSDVTGVDEDRSRFFLESSNWQLEVALSSFYEHGGNADLSGGQGLGAAAVLSDSSEGESPPPPPITLKKKDKKPKKSTNSRFATLDSLQQSSSSDEEEGQAFYAGGSERSGQQILGPGKNKRGDIVSEMFKSVRERGAVETDPAEENRPSSAFSGTGYRLGATNVDHIPVSVPTQNSNQEVRSVRLQLYGDGFTVDGGALRQYTDPSNAAFLECVRRGEVPPELVSGMGGGEVRVSLEDQRHKECPKGSSQAQRMFAGKGHLLGSPTPPTVGVTVPTCDLGDQRANERAAQDAISLDETKPVTVIQFRLADGTRLVGRFNHTHTVGNLRQYVTTAVPVYQLQNFVLMTAFPSEELVDPNATLVQAKLLNAVVIQRCK